MAAKDYTAENFKSAMEDVFWRDGGATIGKNRNKVKITVPYWDHDCSDDPSAFEFIFNIKNETLEANPIPHKYMWGGEYTHGLDTPEKVRYALECAYDHQWRNWND